MSDRLKRHGIAWRMRGFPIYDDEYPYDQIGVVTEDEWKWEDLTAEERSWLTDQASDLVAESERRTPGDPISNDIATWLMLGAYGIACFHRWRYHDDPRGVPFMKDCPICHRSQPLPGEVYRVGDGWMRLTETPPTLFVPRPSGPSAWVNDPDPSPTASAPQVDEYRWDGRRYVPA